MNVLTVYGFMFRLTYPVKCGNTTEQRSKVWYVRLDVLGCPSVQEIYDYVFDNMNGQFNPTIYPTPIGIDTAYRGK